jgi:hypothetical protein
MAWDPHDIRLAQRIVQAALDVTPDLRARLTIEISAAIGFLFLDFLDSLDPDMPKRPIMKILGPLVGDSMMNDKLNRLNEIADKLGPSLVYLNLMIGQLERRR